MREQIDFLLLAPLNVEIKSLVKQINNTGWELYETDEIRNCYRASYNERRIVVFQLQGQGCLKSSFQTMNLLNLFDPEYTISFGIAGSLQDDIKLVDVIFGETVYYYEPAKEAKKKSLSNIFSQNQVYACHKPPKIKHDDLGTFAIHYEQPIASGEKLIADIDSNSRRLILTINRKMAGVEMEAAGVSAAVKNHYHCSERNKFILVKGVSDLANLDKNNTTANQPSETQRQSTAATNAAAALFRIIECIKPEYQTIQINTPRIENAKSLESIFKLWIDKFSREITECTIDYDLLRRIAFHCKPLTSYCQSQYKIPIYYHWRQLNNDGLHLVDYLHLILLRKLSRSNLIEPAALITTNDTDITSFQSITEQIEKIIGNRPVYSSQITNSYREYITYCYNNGYDGNEFDDLQDNSHKFGRQGTSALHKWLPYIAYQSRHLGACIILCWDEHKSIYQRLLLKILPLHAIMFYHGTIKIGGVEAKLKEPGKDLIITPHNFRAVNEWSKKQTKSNLNDVIRFIQCLNDNNVDTINSDLRELIIFLQNKVITTSGEANE